ncbi:hypothetical protein VOLCADRAFT_98325 [Volvox carteri f. nagariensis]|uniref:UBX domain-containing protein n=1 Tax=Volvox carteri f. nagariensis TaxID=3068 RepID=D8UEX6_VOLCA|nr:uncharacterized protein VOLCADRAFT_98325 [Volvox carteri f. nagariensis]EFJ41718.1 hypothetical protein VOLCADRAFT_98325 [Volvox carteri f. nagariensis]|eukprot:XP_002957220.1 hypothetical protein VOLCADRAFT_98325 [Volvox carteri f. nagariensis]
MADSGGDLVANFMAITGADDGVAIQMLEAANFNLEDAVQLFFAAEGNVGGDQGAGAGGGSGGGDQRNAASPGLDNTDPDGVRAPLPTKIERLYGDDFDPRPMYQYHGLNGRQQQAAQIDVFRDFRAETTAAASAAQGSGTAAAPAAAAGGSTQGLSGLFKLPADLVFSGNADQARELAKVERKWLLLNIQSATEFASHRLNRDTWSHEALKEVLKGMFVFYQTHETSADGRALIKAYRLESQGAPSSACPAILVVDPLTGAQMWHRAGFIDAEKLMEELVPFMDHGPMDAGTYAQRGGEDCGGSAANLAQSNIKRKAGTAAGGADAAASASRPGAPMTEDEELALAIAMSMERGGVAGRDSPMAVREDGDQMADELDDLDEAAIWSQIQAAERAAATAAAGGTGAGATAAVKDKTPEEVAAEALARVPPEPPAGDSEACRVALRMPDGSRVTRSFRRTDTVRALFDLCVAHVPEAAAGRSLVITLAAPPGQPPLDPEQTIGAAGVAGAMLAVKLGE